jgi:DNA-binding IclR family transcriptional regulator
VVQCLRDSPAGSTPAEVAVAAEIPGSAAHRIIRKLAAKWLIRRNELSRWAAAELLLHVPRLVRVVGGG